MKNTASLLLLLLSLCGLNAQIVSPAVSAWLQNTTETGSYYVSGNSTPIDNGVIYNCQTVEYSADFVYVHANGIPAYPTGPFLDGNPSVAESQNAMFKFPLDPQPNTGTPDPTVMGNIGLFVNGVALFDYRDGVSWNPATNALCGGPGNPPCPGGPQANMDWNRDAVPAENDGFDCSKAHPAQGNYHHHQNPSAFKLDQNTVSDICNLYDSEGLYTIDSSMHSPLVGFAYDGYPIYGAYGFENADGSGAIVRIRSGYQLRNIGGRTHHADGTDVPDGPAINSEYFLGYFKEDYEWIAHPAEEEFLDEHNGRLCVTPEYPDGTYAYFTTVDENWNSAFPYAVGPTFYGNYENRVVTTIGEATEVYVPGAVHNSQPLQQFKYKVINNSVADLIAVQINNLVRNDITVQLHDLQGKVVQQKTIKQGSTIAFFDVQTVYDGIYFVKLFSDTEFGSQKILLSR